MLNLTVMTCSYMGTTVAEVQVCFCFVVKAIIYSAEKQKEDQRKKKIWERREIMRRVYLKRETEGDKKDQKK